jgi:hypothetical protein
MTFAGDKPQVRFVDSEYCYGTLLLGYARGESSKWFHEFDNITTRFYPARVVWEMSDSSLGAVRIRCEAAAQATGNGMMLKLSVDGKRAGDKVIWAFGGGTPKRPDSGLPTLIWEFDPSFQPHQTVKGLTPDLCSGNRAETSGEAFILTPRLSKGKPDDHTYVIGPPSKRVAWGACSACSHPSVGDASALGSPLALAGSKPGALPVVYGQFPAGEASKPVYWAIQAGEIAQAEDFLRSGKGLSRLPALHDQAVKRAMDLANRVVVHTPDPALDVAVSFSSAALDGTWYPPHYVHGATVWNGPMPGWRRLYGPTAYGWHENVKADLKYFLDSQVKESPNTKPKADPTFGLALQAHDSRFFGKGRITKDHTVYDMQSLLFDQAVHAWRWTADAELETLLPPALELNLEWQRECFDADGNGLYESYANAWATDSAWYNGGEGNQTTAFAYRGHLAAADMARRAGDANTEHRHRERAELIRRNTKDILWMQSDGHPAEYREALGQRRLHPDPCLYSIFFPIDARLFSPVEAVQALYYTEWGLQRDVSPLGGELCWSSNWVPWGWSLRELYAGENFHLALAYYQTGLAAEGWKILMGNYREWLYNRTVPGGLSHQSCGTDFSDIASPFCRLIVEGLFGYVPDRPNGQVVLRPQFPQDWDHASIRTPDFEFAYQRETESMSWRVTLIQPARMEFHVPVCARAVGAVTVNGKAAEWRAEAGFGRSVIVVQAPAGRAAELCVRWKGEMPSEPSLHVAATVGQSVELPVKHGNIVNVVDPTGLLRGIQIDGAVARATVTPNAGNRVVLVLAKTGDLEQWHMFKMAVRDPEAEAQRRAQTLAAAPADARWEPISLGGVLNANVCDVYKQKYLSPRVQTCSTQLATDGFANWTWVLWGCKPPAIDLANVPTLLGADGRLLTPQGVHFLWPGDGKNIAFTTQYDNFPKSVGVPVARSGRAAWFLVAGTTNPFQTKIANAVLKLRYADGVVETLDLVPPRNYWMLSDKGWSYRKDVDAFCLPNPGPPMVQLGSECRAMVLNRVMRPGVVLEHVELETLSQEVVVGLMGLTIMH